MPNPTLDLHPDADSLNGFVEQALPEGERQQVLAHISVCSRCRQVIFLAQDAAASNVEMPAAVTLPSTQSPVRTPAWLTNWRLLWIPLAACAAILAVTVYLTQKPQAPNNQVAKMESSPNPPIANPPPPQGTSPAPAFSNDRLSQTKSTARNSHPSPVRTTSKALSTEATSATTIDSHAVAKDSSNAETISPAPPPPLPVPSASYPAGDQTLVAGNQLASKGVAGDSALKLQQRSRVGSQKSALAVMAKPAPQPPAAAIPNTQTQSSNSGNSEVAAAPLTPAAASKSLPAGAAANTSSLHTHRTMSQAATTLNLSASSASASTAASDDDYARMALYTMLPNGLTAISTAAAQHRLLAIDSAGALFLSNDFGKSWELIAQQWTSKALQVRVNKSLSSRPAPSAPNQPSAAQAESGVSRPHFALPPTPSAVFEIVTDDGSIWTSPDGKTWKAK